MSSEPVVTTTAELRWLLKSARGKLSQAKAAQRAGISASWWKQIENATQPAVSEGLLLRMCDAVTIMPASLRAVGHEKLADALADRHRVLGAVAPFEDALDRYLWAAPADPATRNALIAYARQLREVRVPARAASPFTDGFLATRRDRFSRERAEWELRRAEWLAARAQRTGQAVAPSHDG